MDEHDLTDYEQRMAWLNGCLYCDGGSRMGHAAGCPHGPPAPYVERKPGPQRVTAAPRDCDEPTPMMVTSMDDVPTVPDLELSSDGSLREVPIVVVGWCGGPGPAKVEPVKGEETKP